MAATALAERPPQLVLVWPDCPPAALVPPTPAVNETSGAAEYIPPISGAPVTRENKPRHRKLIAALAVSFSGIAYACAPPSTPANPMQAGCTPGEGIIYGAMPPPGSPPEITFRFDDGPSSANTLPIQQEFNARNLTRAAEYQEIGNQVTASPANQAAARQLVAWGVSIGNHSMTHPDGNYPLIATEMPQAKPYIQQNTGTPAVIYASPPGNTIDPGVQNAIASAGMCQLSTIDDYRDWVGPVRLTEEQLFTNFVALLKPGIINLHDGGGDRPTAHVIGRLLDYAISKGFKIVSMQEYLMSGPHAHKWGDMVSWLRANNYTNFTPPIMGSSTPASQILGVNEKQSVSPELSGDYHTPKGTCFIVFF